MRCRPCRTARQAPLPGSPRAVVRADLCVAVRPPRRPPHRPAPPVLASSAQAHVKVGGLKQHGRLARRRSSSKCRTLADLRVGFGAGLCAAVRAGPRAGFCFRAPPRAGIARADLRASVRPPRCPPHRPPRRRGFVSRSQCQTGRVEARRQSPVTARED